MSFVKSDARKRCHGLDGRFSRKKTASENGAGMEE